MSKHVSNLFQEIVDMFTGSNVVDRQNRQWSMANTQLAEAKDAMDELDRRAQNTDLADLTRAELASEAVARALVGLLAERLSER